MKGWINAVVLAGLAIFMLALPAIASAKPGYAVINGSRFGTFEAKGSNGFEIFFFWRSPNTAALIATKGGSSVTYIVHKRMIGNRLSASFGHRGRVMVRFKPSETAQMAPGQSGRCRGRGGISQIGNLVGKIKFRGEERFTELDTNSMEGQMVRFFRLVCKKGPETGQGPEDPADGSVSLIAHARSHRRDLTFAAYKMSSRAVQRTGSNGGAVYSATLAEHLSRMSIYRSADANAPANTFAVSPLGLTPATGSVIPPSPFSGSANFERSIAGGGSHWSGDLSAEFPGRGKVRLAGPSFSVGLCRTIGCACNQRHGCLVVTFGEQTRSATEPATSRLRAFLGGKR